MPEAVEQQKLMAERLFERIAASGLSLRKSPYAINIGCGDGKQYCDPVYGLYAKGFTGAAIDGQEHPDLATNLGKFDVTLRVGVLLTPANVGQVLREAGCPLNPEFLKIDIDSFDGDVLRAILLGGVRPLVIQAEVNSEFPPPFAFNVCFSKALVPDYRFGFFGFSLQYGADLLSNFGYHLVELDFDTSCTHDGLWVHEALISAGGIRKIDPSAAFLSVGPCLPHVGGVSGDQKLAWRTRTDLDAVHTEMWGAMLENCARTYGHTKFPFELYISR